MRTNLRTLTGMMTAPRARGRVLAATAVATLVALAGGAVALGADLSGSTETGASASTEDASAGGSTHGALDLGLHHDELDVGVGGSGGADVATDHASASLAGSIAGTLSLER